MMILWSLHQFVNLNSWYIKNIDKISIRIIYSINHSDNIDQLIYCNNEQSDFFYIFLAQANRYIKLSETFYDLISDLEANR